MESKLQETLRQLNQVSPSICLAKWLHTTIHLHSGMTHSCYHNPPHKIELDNLTQNPKSIFWTETKKRHQTQMLLGQKPKDCQFCWTIEAQPQSEHLSDRIIKSSADWAAPSFPILKESHFKADPGPTYLEVSFSRVCQMKCVYCGPHYSTAWQNEIESNGPFATLEHNFESLSPADELKIKNHFFQILPESINRLKVLRITGGEPLLAPEFWKMLEQLEDSKSGLELMINTNLSVPESRIQKLISAIASLKKNGAVGKVKIITSLEAIEAKAEMIRFGLDYNLFLRNFSLLVSSETAFEISITSTVSRLSVRSYGDFLNFFTQFREKGFKNNFILDPSPLKKPDFLNLININQNEKNYLTSQIETYLSCHFGKYTPLEGVKLNALLSVLKSPTQENQSAMERQYIQFLKELESRYRKPYFETFTARGE